MPPPRGIGQSSRGHGSLLAAISKVSSSLGLHEQSLSCKDLNSYRSVLPEHYRKVTGSILTSAMRVRSTPIQGFRSRYQGFVPGSSPPREVADAAHIDE